MGYIMNLGNSIKSTSNHGSYSVIRIILQVSFPQIRDFTFIKLRNDCFDYFLKTWMPFF